MNDPKWTDQHGNDERLIAERVLALFQTDERAKDQALRFDPDGIEQDSAGDWVIPVYTERETGSARDLLRILAALEEELERQLGATFSLYLAHHA